jgi:hypothetical protein
MEQKQVIVAEAKERGPSPGVPALIYFLLFAGGIAFNMISTSGASFPTPYDPVEKAQAYYSTYAGTTRIYALIIFWSALPLGVYTAFMTARLRALKVHRGGTNIALYGGIAASVFIGLSGLCTWILSQPGITENGVTTRAIQLLGFATGGTGNVVLAGLLMAGISMTAGLDKLFAGWLMVLGMVLAVVSVVSMFNMVLPSLSILLPLGRFLGMIWMIIAGFTIKKSKTINGLTA